MSNKAFLVSGNVSCVQPVYANKQRSTQTQMSKLTASKVY